MPQVLEHPSDSNQGTKRNDKMSKYRFAGTLKEIETSSTVKVLRFVPDQECAVTEDRDGKKVTFAVFLPADDSGEGIVVRYEGKIYVTDKGKVKWVPSWNNGEHYSFVLEAVKEENDCEIKIETTSVSKYFKLESVIEKV